MFTRKIPRLGIVRSERILSGLVKDSCQFGCTERVCDALEVVCHCRETNFGFRAGQSTQQETGVSEYSVLDRRKGMLDGGSTQPHRFWRHSFLHTIQRFFIRVAGQATPRSLRAPESRKRVLEAVG
jgi:hypothetical protein